jgi:uncharacterized protein DUF4159
MRNHGRQWRKIVLGIAAGLILCLLTGIAGTQFAVRVRDTRAESPEAEFHIARVKYRTFGGAGSHGIIQPWWAIDYPFAEEHFLPALRRLTNVSVDDDEKHLELTDDRIFQYPFLFLQQPGQGNWRPTSEEAARLREHLLRGGFLLVDDLHGQYDWAIFQAAMQRVMPDRPIVDIPESDPLMHVFYDLDQSTPIPGERHLRMTRGGEIVARMEGPQRWRGIYDDHHRLMVAINFNMDMGDAWEHADDPYYPVPMTALAYKFGVNYVVYAMTH